MSLYAKAKVANEEYLLSKKETADYTGVILRFATAFGLFAAIPATIAYNRLVSQVEDIGNRYTAFVEEIFVILQRQK